MSIHHIIRNAVVAGALAAIAMPALAANNNLLPMPQPMHEGNITYVTGGVGDAERNDLQAQAKDYDLLITDSNKKGQFTADSDFTIANKNGREVVKITDGGPLLYANLPPGQYKVTATNGTQRQVEDVKISPHRDDYLHLIWRQS